MHAGLSTHACAEGRPSRRGAKTLREADVRPPLGGPGRPAGSLFHRLNTAAQRTHVLGLSWLLPGGVRIGLSVPAERFQPFCLPALFFCSCLEESVCSFPDPQNLIGYPVLPGRDVPPTHPRSCSRGPGPWTFHAGGRGFCDFPPRSPSGLDGALETAPAPAGP